MLHNYAPWCGLEAYRRGSDHDQFLCEYMGKKYLEGVNPLSHQCIGGKR